MSSGERRFGVPVLRRKDVQPRIFDELIGAARPNTVKNRYFTDSEIADMHASHPGVHESHSSAVDNRLAARYRDIGDDPTHARARHMRASREAPHNPHASVRSSSTLRNQVSDESSPQIGCRLLRGRSLSTASAFDALRTNGVPRDFGQGAVLWQNMHNLPNWIDVGSPDYSPLMHALHPGSYEFVDTDRRKEFEDWTIILSCLQRMDNSQLEHFISFIVEIVRNLIPKPAFLENVQPMFQQYSARLARTADVPYVLAAHFLDDVFGTASGSLRFILEHWVDWDSRISIRERHALFAPHYALLARSVSMQLGVSPTDFNFFR